MWFRIPAHASFKQEYCFGEPSPTPTASPTEEPTATPEPTTEPSQEPSSTPEATPSSEPQQAQGDSFSAPGHPECTATPPTQTMANFHAYRKGGDAVLKWFPTEGDKANIYYKQNGSADWQYSKLDIDNNGYTEIHDLGGLDITFAGQQANECAGGPLTTAVVDGKTSGWVLFR